MTLLENTFAAWSHGATPSAGASGGIGGQAFSAIIQGAGGLIEGSSDHPLQGSIGCHVVAVASQSTYLDMVDGSSGAARSGRIGIIMPSGGNTSGVGQSVMQMISGATRVATLGVNSTNKFYLQNRVGGTIATGAITIPWAFGTSIWGEFYVSKGTGTLGDATGNAKFRWFVGDTLQETITTGMSNNVDVGITDMTGIRYARGTAASQPIEYWIGGVGMETAPATPTNPADGFIGVPAIGDVTANVNYGAHYIIDARPSTAPGGSESLIYSIEQDSGPAEIPEQVFAGYWKVSQDTTTEKVYTVTVGDGSTTDTAEITVPVLAIGGSPIVPGHSRMRTYNGSIWA